MERIFRELLPEAGLHVREEQIRLCHEMLDALMKNEITLCDAGVGIGKTYAYLTACILMRKYSVLHSGYSGCDRRPVVVSTSSIALQKAIIEEYVPFLSDVLLKADLLQGELKAVVRKGKEHFVCDYRLAQRLEAVRDKNKNQAQMEALKSLRHNFDLDSVHNLSGFDRRLVCVPKFCPRECPGKAGCRYQKYLDVSKKEEVFIQICNHNYLLADAMHRMNEYRPLLADYRALVVDEAHKLPEAASQMDGRSIGREDVQEISYFLNREHKSSEGKRLQDWFNTLSMEIRKDQAGMGDDIAGKENFYFPSDMYLYPDLDSFAIFPWNAGGNRVARLICDVYGQDGLPFAGDPRNVLKRVMVECQKMGYKFNVGPECEFFLFHTDEEGRPTTVSHEKAGYFDVAPLDLGESARRDMILNLEDMGFEIEASHHEVAPAQHEIDFKYDNALRTADNILTFKFIVKYIAKRHGLYASFMPKPITGVDGSGMHLNMSLWKNGKNIFADSKNDLGISEEAFHFMAGVMEHANEMCLITNPLVNSYKRIVPGYEAPVDVSWSPSNRSPLIRVPAARGSGTRLEFRSPDSAANPYLALAVSLAAGLDGIKRKLHQEKVP